MDHQDAEGEAFLSVVGGTATPPTATNGVRDADLPTAEVVAFPADAVIRRQPGNRGDQVLITHRGDSLTFESPEALHEQLRDTDPVLRDLRAAARADAELARELNHQAAVTLTLAEAAKAQADRRLRFIGRAAVTALLLGAVCLLGAI